MWSLISINMNIPFLSWSKVAPNVSEISYKVCTVSEAFLFCQNPEYHGFSSDPVVDEWNMKVGFFFGISVALVIGGTFIHYLPDHGWVFSSSSIHICCPRWDDSGQDILVDAIWIVLLRCGFIPSSFSYLYTENTWPHCLTTVF